MSNALLDYSSWSFQLVFVIVVLYSVVGLIRPSWVLAKKRSTVVVVSVLAMVIASTAFYIAIKPLQSTTKPSAGAVPAPG